MKQIYLDHNATTPVDPEVIEAMLPYLRSGFGNASSVHAFGREAKVALENSREQVAAFINCQPSELYFTSGGTESDNLAVLGTAYELASRKKHIVIGAAEHDAVLKPAEYLARDKGFMVKYLPVDDDGFAPLDRLAELITEQTALVSVMHANHETGTIQDIRALAAVARKSNVLFHTDAVQSVGKIKVDVKELGVDMLSLSGHKIYGPKGVGALFIRRGVKISPLFYGGGHEKKHRPGTENIAGVVGLARSLQVAERRLESDGNHISKLAEFFIEDLLEKVPDCRLNGPRSNRLSHTVNVSFEGVEGESLVLSLDMEGIAVSSGSACSSGTVDPSHVLTAMGVPAVAAQGAIRFSLGRSTTREDLEHVLDVLPPIIERLRAMSPVYNNQNE